MSKSIVTLSLIALSLSSSVAQDFRSGYILKLNGDSLAGFVDYRSDKRNAKSCWFKTSTKSKKIEYKPTELKGYGFQNDKVYTSRNITVPGKTTRLVFLQVLVQGKASLFKYVDLFLMERDSLFVLPQQSVKEVDIKDSKAQNADAQRYQMTERKYIGILNYVMSDCHLNANKTRYEERSLVNLIQNYNRCMGSAGLVYKSNKPWTKLSWSVLAGVDQSTLKGSSDFDFKTSISVPAGVGLELSSPRLSDKNSFTLDVWYVKKLFQGYGETISATQLRSDWVINASFLKLPFGFRHNFFQEARTPYFRVGVVPSFLLYRSSQILSETQSGGVVTTERSNPEIMNKSQLGFWMGAGYCQRINWRFIGFVEVRYEKNSAFIFPAPINSPSTGVTMSLLVGLRF
jgi:hypothetical protein